MLYPAGCIVILPEYRVEKPLGFTISDKDAVWTDLPWSDGLGQAPSNQVFYTDIFSI